MKQSDTVSQQKGNRAAATGQAAVHEGLMRMKEQAQQASMHGRHRMRSRDVLRLKGDARCLEQCVHHRACARCCACVQVLNLCKCRICVCATHRPVSLKARKTRMRRSTRNTEVALMSSFCSASPTYLQLAQHAQPYSWPHLGCYTKHYAWDRHAQPTLAIRLCV